MTAATSVMLYFWTMHLYYYACFLTRPLIKRAPKTDHGDLRYGNALH